MRLFELGIDVVSPCYVLFVFCGQGSKGAWQFPDLGSQDRQAGAATAPPFYFPGAG